MAQQVRADTSRDLETMILPEFANPDYGTAADATENLAEATGEFSSISQVRTAIGHLGLPAYAPIAFRSGTYRVGTEPGMVPPGTYVAESEFGFDGCYWATLDSVGDIIENNFVGSGFRVVATVSGAALSVEFDDCGWFIKQ